MPTDRCESRQFCCRTARVCGFAIVLIALAPGVAQALDYTWTNLGKPEGADSAAENVCLVAYASADRGVPGDRGVGAKPSVSSFH